jgi:hypothetical protein
VNAYLAQAAIAALLGSGLMMKADSSDTPTSQDQSQSGAGDSSGMPLAIELAGNTDEQIWPVDAGTYRLLLVNAIPGRTYVVNVGASESLEIAPFTAPSGIARGASVRQAKEPGCKRLKEALKLFDATAERQVPSMVSNVHQAQPCTDAQDNAQVTDILSATIRAVDSPVVIPPDSRRTVRIVREFEVWNVTLTAVPRGKWQTLFGWTFAPNNDEEYFSEAAGENQFMIRRRTRDEGSFTSLPSLFWTWLPSRQAFGNLQHGPTVGLGVTVGGGGSRAGVLAGWTLRWNQNVGVVGGVALYPHRRLDGKYVPDQTIPANLEPDQLNRDSIRPNFFVGLTLRFAQDPRGEKKEEGKKQ